MRLINLAVNNVGQAEDSHSTALSLLIAALSIGSAVIGLLVFVAIVVVVVVLVRRNDPTRKAPTSSGLANTLEFTVGEIEPHVVVFRFDKMWGWITITVDGEIVVKHLVTASVSLVTPFEFEVGENEQHAVRIEKHRSLAFAFARPQPIKAFVDGVLVAENAG